ncbi:MAG: hypothetical protein C4542_09710 [Dehalococcoidia bacterium]|nr:MAG: hypothetical protein C4542_09710 [Dehalococcoidia bacterium]
MTRHLHASWFVDNFTLPELRRYLTDFELEAWTSNEEGASDVGFWEELADIARLAIKTRKHRDGYLAPRRAGGPRRLDPEEVKERVDLVDLIGRDVTLKRAGNAYRGLCPFHRERTPSFFVFPDHNRFKCFGCDKGGDAFVWVMESMGLTFSGALEYLAREAGLPGAVLHPAHPPRRILPV